MKVIILGGTGLIGHHTTEALLAHGHEVTIVSRGSVKIDDNLQNNVKAIETDVFNLSEAELSKLFANYDYMVYALGPDDREVPARPADIFFKKYLVDKCLIICNAAKSAGIQQAILVSSYFSYFDRINPGWKLSEHHPYIKCRVQQSEQSIALSSDSFKVIVLEVPYVFGVIDQREPLWKDQLVVRLNMLKPFLVFTTGGTAMTSVQFMAQAVCGALEHGKTGTYIVGEENMSWHEMLSIASSALTGFRKNVITIPSSIAQLYAYYHKFKNQIGGKQAGLNYPKYIKQVQCKYTYFPEALMQQTAVELKITRGSVRNAMHETFLRCN